MAIILRPSTAEPEVVRSNSRFGDCPYPHTCGHAAPSEASLKAEMRLWPILGQNLPFNKRPSCWRNAVSVGGKLVVGF
jgi:hypothetical protein